MELYEGEGVVGRFSILERESDGEKVKRCGGVKNRGLEGFVSSPW